MTALPPPVREAGHTAPERERDLLVAMDESYHDLGPVFFSFRTLGRRVSRDDLAQIRRDVRRMARKGLVQFGKGLWTEDGPAGSGYAITDAGKERLARESGR